MNRSTRPVAAMVWKEGRETLKWAALVLLGTAIALVYVLWRHRGPEPVENGYAHAGTPLLAEEFQGVTIAAGALAGLLFALAQTLPEKRLDKWAFLVHRPVAPSKLLLGKILAGLGLYVLAVGLPYAAAVIWIATPGHVPAPFAPGMLRPGVADLLAGAMYYFAGMVIGLREARWYGSRVLALAPAVVGSFAVVLLHEFWQALLVIAVVTAFLATAAWANFVYGGDYEPQPRPAKVALGVSVFAGVVMLGGFGVALLAELLPQPQNVVVYYNYSMTANCKVIRFETRNSEAVKVTDVDGQPLPEFDGVTDWNNYNEKLGRPIEVGLSVNPEWAGLSWIQSYRHSERYFHEVSPVEANAQAPRAYWYFVNRGGYVVGYDMRDRNPAGYVTPDGFHAQLDQATSRFDAEGVQAAALMGKGTDLWLPSGVYRIRTDVPRVDVVFSAPAGERLMAAGAAYHAADPNPKTMEPPKLAFEAFATSTRVYVRPPDGQTAFSAPLEYSVKDYPSVSVTKAADGRYVLWYTPGYDSPAAWRRPHHLTEFSPKGEVIGRRDLPALTPPESAPDAAHATLFGVTVPPAGVALGMLAMPVWMEGQTLRDQMEMPETRWMLKATLLSGLVCAALTLALGRRYAFSGASLIGWTVGNFLLGPAGVLTMLSLRSWPALVRCPSCGRARAVNREKCPRCAAEFALPPLDGTEIFAV